jgi:hypothetical protein
VALLVVQVVLVKDTINLLHLDQVPVVHLITLVLVEQAVLVEHLVLLGQLDQQAVMVVDQA